ncbi:hypothetical protein D3C81_298530 [compost metagenome]
MRSHEKYLIVLFCLLSILSGCYNSNSITEKELNQFVNKENLKFVSIKRLNNSEAYIFSSPYIYIYRDSSNFSKSTVSIRNGISFGGLEKGSIGLIINNTEVLRNANTYCVVIDGKTREYEYLGEKYLIIEDYRIWNPTAQMKIQFLNDKNEKLFETDY